MVAGQKRRKGTEGWGRGEIVSPSQVQADCIELPAEERQPLKAARVTDQHGSVVDCEGRHSLKAASVADLSISGGRVIWYSPVGGSFTSRGSGCS